MPARIPVMIPGFRISQAQQIDSSFYYKLLKLSSVVLQLTFRLGEVPEVRDSSAWLKI
jgi:hypothetical protein